MSLEVEGVKLQGLGSGWVTRSQEHQVSPSVLSHLRIRGRPGDWRWQP